jgi:hypothetical protein
MPCLAIRDAERRALSMAAVICALGCVALAQAQPGGSEPSDTNAGARAEPPAEASAETRARARQLADEGVRQIREGRVDRGIASLREAQELVPVPTIALEIARALVSVGRLSEAVEAYRETTAMALPAWLRGMPRITQEHAQREARGELAVLVKRVPKVRLVLLGIPAERVAIDGEELSSSSIGKELYIDPGIHVFEAERGDTSVRKEVRLTEGDAISVALRLEAGKKQAEKVAPAEPAPRPPAAERKREEPSAAQPIAGYALLGLAGACLGATIGTWVVGADLASGLEPSCPEQSCDPATLGSDGMEDLERYRALRTATIALGVATAAAAAVGLSLVLSAPSGSETAAVLQLGPANLGIDVRF